MSDNDWFEKVPRFPQRQDGMMTQVIDLHRVANRLGLYDAADWLIARVMAKSGEGNWDDLRERLEEAEQELRQKAEDDPGIGRSTHWLSKAEGVGLALSYMREYMQEEEAMTTATWEPTHYSIGDGSVVRMVTTTPFVIENEDGESWEDDPSLWAPLDRD